MVKNTINILFRYLPIRISEAVHLLPKGIFQSVNEIRLRTNAPVSVTVGTENIMFDEKGRLCSPDSAIRATEAEILECVSRLTDGSLYTCDEYVSAGFIPLAEGGRAGVCGKANIHGGKMMGFSEIYSVNLRLHRFIPNAAQALIEEFETRGICGCLVCSPPAIGKTTFLRSIGYLLSAGKGIAPIRVGIADERAELSAGMPNAGLADIIVGAPKSDAISLLTRTMSPQVIICDEISPSETEAVLEAQNTGVHLIASAHCSTPKDLLKRGRMKSLIDSGIFPVCAILKYDGQYTYTIGETEEFL